MCQDIVPMKMVWLIMFLLHKWMSIRATDMPVLKPFFAHQNWHNRCINRLSRMGESKSSSNLTRCVDCRFVKVASAARTQRPRPKIRWNERLGVRESCQCRTLTICALKKPLNSHSWDTPALRVISVLARARNHGTLYQVTFHESLKPLRAAIINKWNDLYQTKAPLKYLEPQILFFLFFSK